MVNSKIKIIFYKGIRGTLLDKLISIWTFGKYSHLELYDEATQTSYSASSRDKGVRSKKIKLDPAKWDIFDIDIDEEFLNTFYEKTKDMKYDWLGIFFYHFFPFQMQDDNKWYCSEWVSEVLQFSGYAMKTNLTPSGIYRNLKTSKVIS